MSLFRKQVPFYISPIKALYYPSLNTIVGKCIGGNTSIGMMIFMPIIAFMACNDDEMVKDDEGVQLIENFDLEEGDSIAPTDWFSSQNSESFIAEYTNKEAFSGEKSMSLFYPGQSSNDEFASWVLTVPLDGEIHVGKKVTLRVMIKGNLVGRGGSLGMVGWNGPERVSVITTPLHMPFIIGDFDWEEFSLFDIVEEDVNRYVLLLAMESSTGGSIYFDNVTLTLSE